MSGIAELLQPDGGFFLIAGPCVLEDDALNLAVAGTLRLLAEELRIPIIFKASFDKANRSSAGSQRGPGLEDGLRKLERVRSETGLPLLTDVHEAHQCQPVADVVDVLQIPAFLCRQTDLLAAAGATGRAVNVKKGQWMAPHEMRGAVEKLRGAGASAVAVTERGTFFGYGNLVVDMRSFAGLREACDAPTVFDGTHSVQRPGEGGGVSGGEPRHILVYDVAGDGAKLANGKILIDAGPQGTPDGMRCDIDGNLWCGWGMTPALDGVRVFTAQGEPIGHITLPERCANLCFGGRKRNRLFMAAAHSLYSLYVNTQGVAGG